MAREAKRQIAKEDQARPNIGLFIILVAIAVVVVIFIDKMDFYRKFKTADQRLWLGVETVELTPGIKAQFDIQSANGLLVSRTFTGSPAQLGGICDGDIIRRWNGITVTSPEQLENLIQTSDTDKRIKATVDRQGKSVLVYIRVGIRPGGI